MENTGSGINRMRNEANDVASEFEVAEFMAGKTLQEVPVVNAGDDLARIKSEISRKEVLDGVRTALGEVADGIEDTYLERVAELSASLGDKFDAQRPEIKLALAKLPVTGLGLQLDEDGEVANNGQEISPEQIAFVRVTDHLPTDREGKKVVLTAYEATKDTDPIYRLTSHWTVNHVVHSHIMGDFEGRQVTIIVPGQQMLKENGAPDVLLPVDTFWNKNIQLPKGAIILSYKETDESENIVVLNREDDSETIALLALKASGYTTVQDHPTYTETGFDLGVVALGKRMGVEGDRLHTDMKTKETAIENFFHPSSFSETEGLALERLVGEYWDELPIELQQAVIGKLKELAHAKGSVEEKHKVYESLDSVVINIGDKYPLTTRTKVVSSLPFEVLENYIENESNYWSNQGESNKDSMVDQYLEFLAEYLDTDMMTKLKEKFKREG